jgi:hypothetical protein
MDYSTRKLEIGYEASVLWKKRVLPVLPNNKDSNQFSVSDQQLSENLTKGTLWALVSESSSKEFNKGYACLLSREETASQPNYHLPDYGVVPKSQWGHCLNDYVISGQAVQNLFAVVTMKFMEIAMAWLAYIRVPCSNFTYIFYLSHTRWYVYSSVRLTKRCPVSASIPFYPTSCNILDYGRPWISKTFTQGMCPLSAFLAHSGPTDDKRHQDVKTHLEVYEPRFSHRHLSTIFPWST